MRPAAAAAGTEAASINLHGVWVPPVLGAPGDKKFREGLVESYMVLTDDAIGRAANVEPHLWTNRAADLFKPVFLGHDGNRVELELPHSMLAAGPVSLHTEHDLLAALEKVPQADLRQLFKQVYHHPANVNIGFRADVTRLLIGMLYTRHDQHSSSAPHPTELNIYADIDKVASLQREREELGQPDLSARESRTRALAESVEKLVLPPAPGPISHLDIEQLAEAPQRSWSVRDPAMPGRAEAIPVSTEFAERGLISRKEENDVLAMVPGHHQVREVAQNILRILDNKQFETAGEPSQKHFDKWQKNTQIAGSMLQALRTGVEPATEISTENAAPTVRPQPVAPDKLMDMLRFAEQMRTLKPQLAERVAQLEKEAAAEGADGPAQRKMLAVVDVYKWNMKMIQSVVNMSTYVAQIDHTVAGNGEPLEELGRSLFGVKMEINETSGESWNGGLNPKLAERAPSVEVALLSEMFDEIRSMMKSRTLP